MLVYAPDCSIGLNHNVDMKSFDFTNFESAADLKSAINFPNCYFKSEYPVGIGKSIF